MQLKMRGQASVEYLYVLVFLIAFIVAVIIPAVRESEVSLAVASARSAASSYETENTDHVVTTLSYGEEEGKIYLKPEVRSRLDGSVQPLPDGLKEKILGALKTIGKAEGECVKAANYEYCVRG